MRPHNVLVAVRINAAPGREILSGIFSFIEAGHPWQIRLLQSPEELTVETLRAAESAGIDGIIAAMSTSDAAATQVLREVSCPVVFQSRSFPRPAGPSAFVWNDNAALGIAGARHFLSLGAFASYAFVLARRNGRGYSEERLAGFTGELAKNGHDAPLAFDGPDDDGSPEDLVALATWLQSLPKPAAVMVACDWRALHVLDAARRAHLKVPQQVAVLGTDNDEMLVSHSSPPLSSVHPGHFEIGLREAMELERLMNARKPRPIRETRIGPRGVVERDSTTFVRPAVHLVERAQKFIVQNACRAIDVRDVVAHLGCSRALADLRFREATGFTLRAAIEAERLRQVQKLLKTTTRSVSAIAAACGFRTASQLDHLFKQRMGLSPRAWRAQT